MACRVAAQSRIKAVDKMLVPNYIQRPELRPEHGPQKQAAGASKQAHGVGSTGWGREACRIGSESIRPHHTIPSERLE